MTKEQKIEAMAAALGISPKLAAVYLEADNWSLSAAVESYQIDHAPAVTPAEELGETFEAFIPCPEKDAKGRQFGYVVGLRGVVGSEKTYAWVQKAVLTASDAWKDWGPVQRSRPFPSLAAARTWAYRTAKERAAK